MSGQTSATPSAPGDTAGSPKREIPEPVFYCTLGVLTLLVASIPYLLGALNTPSGSTYTGMTYNPDDTAVYLSWMRQVVDGSFFQRNLFAVEPQKGMVVNAFGLLLGGVAKLAGGNLIATYHFFRVLFGGLLLWAVALLCRATLDNPRARRLAFALACVGSGIGWVTGGYDPSHAFDQSIDLWQPEAITFLSVYYTPLFTAAQALMVVFALSALRTERTGRVVDALPAAIAGALLANFHTYDIIPLFIFWFLFRAIADGTARKFSGSHWGGFALAIALTLPLLAYQYFALIQDPIFKLRDVKTDTKSPLWLLMGFGIPLVLAIVAALPRRGNDAPFTDTPARNLLILWMATGLLCAYAPVDFQRKLLMGVHLPMCLLSGAALMRLTEKLTGDMPRIVAWLTVLLTMPSNILFLLQDTGRLEANVSSTDVRPYLTRGEMEALDWLRTNARRDEIIFSSPDPTSHRRFPFLPLKPDLSILIPAWTGHLVYNGHGSETPGFGRKIGETIQFFSITTPDEARVSFLKSHNITFILMATPLAQGLLPFEGGQRIDLGNGPYEPIRWTPNSHPEWLKVECQNADVTVYRVVFPETGGIGSVP